MARVARALIEYTGWTGAPGVNVLHWSNAVGTPDDADYEIFQALLEECYNEFRQRLGGGITVQIPQSCDVFDEETGALLDSVTASTAVDPIVSTAGNVESGANALVAKFETAGIVSNRRVRGRAFVGPTADGVMVGNAALPAAMADVVTGFNGLVDVAFSTPALVVWHRPINGAGGVAHPVNAVSCWSKPGSLRSRRD